VNKRLKEHNLTTNIKKSRDEQTTIKFFGVILSADRVKTDPKKCETISRFERPESKSDVRSFLGLTNYCARCIDNYTILIEPLRRAIKAEPSNFSWNLEMENSFRRLKAALAEPKLLSYYDQNIQTTLIVDASPIGLGAILTQKNNDGSNRITLLGRTTLHKN